MRLDYRSDALPLDSTSDFLARMSAENSQNPRKNSAEDVADVLLLILPQTCRGQGLVIPRSCYNLERAAVVSNP